MRPFIGLSIISILIVSCNFLNTGNYHDSKENGYERISNDSSWGFINTKGDTVISLNKYTFLNPMDEEGMIFSKLGDKFGYIDINQNILIPFAYDDLSIFSEGLASAKQNGKYGFIDRKGKVIIPFQFEEESYFYKPGLAKIKAKHKFGFIDKIGNIVIPIEFDDAGNTPEDSFVIVSKNNKWAFFSNNGKQQTEFLFDAVFESTNRNNNKTFGENGLILVTKNGLFGYLNKHFKSIKPFGYYSEAEPINKNGFAIVKNGLFYGIINFKGELVLPFDYELIIHPIISYTNCCEEFYIMYYGKWGLLNEKAENITEPEFDGFTLDHTIINDSIETVFIIKNGNKFGLINKRGKYLLPIKFDEINMFEGDSITYAKKNGKYGLISGIGKTIFPFEYRNIITDNDWEYYIITKDTLCGVIEKISNKVILPFEYESIEPCFYDQNNRFIVKKNGLFGIVTKDRKIIIPNEYDEISNWVEYGPSAHFIIKNGKHGLMGRNGKMIIHPLYDALLINNTKLIRVKLNGRYGTINWKNEIVHAIEYERIFWQWPYLTGKDIDTVYVKKSGKYFATDPKGIVIRKVVPLIEIKSKFEYDLNNE